MKLQTNCSECHNSETGQILSVQYILFSNIKVPDIPRSLGETTISLTTGENSAL